MSILTVSIYKGRRKCSLSTSSHENTGNAYIELLVPASSIAPAATPVAALEIRDILAWFQSQVTVANNQVAQMAV
jgi:hypothetical protein